MAAALSRPKRGLSRGKKKKREITPDCPRSGAKTCGFIDIRTFLNDAGAVAGVETRQREKEREKQGILFHELTIRRGASPFRLPSMLEYTLRPPLYPSPLQALVFSTPLLSPRRSALELRIRCSLGKFEFALSRALNRFRGFRAPPSRRILHPISRDFHPVSRVSILELASRVSLSSSWVHVRCKREAQMYVCKYIYIFQLSRKRFDTERYISVGYRWEQPSEKVFSPRDCNLSASRLVDRLGLLRNDWQNLISESAASGSPPPSPALAS